MPEGPEGQSESIRESAFSLDGPLSVLFEVCFESNDSKHVSSGVKLDDLYGKTRLKYELCALISSSTFLM